MSVSPIWWRQFVRSDANDKDTVADATFRAQNFADFFGTFLQQGNNANLRTFDDVVSIFWNQPNNYSLQIFVIADGAFIPWTAANDSWFTPHIRLLAVVRTLPTSNNQKLYVVGPGAVKEQGGFLQTASWDGTTFRFYGVDSVNGGNTQGWVFQGTSFDAFIQDGPNSAAYLGPFDGHINGALTMKELHSPWYHWLSGASGDFMSCVSPANQKFFKSIPYLTASGSPCFDGAAVGFADTLEPIIIHGIGDWFNSRQTADFATNAQGTTPKSQPSNVQRWMAHVLLTTTVNFQTCDINGSTYIAPLDLFFNRELLTGDFSDVVSSNFLPDMSQFSFNFDLNMYNTACSNLQLSLLQEADPNNLPKGPTIVTLPKGTLGGGKETDEYDQVQFIVAVPSSEGVPFVALQTANEDAQGISNMQSLGQLGNGSNFPQTLISQKALEALIMIDFWNPVYSWRRGVLMQYLPQVTNLVANPLQYDLESNFVSAIRKSSFAATDPTSPESKFLHYYDNGPDQTAMANYFTNVCSNLLTPSGLESYLTLAESRRRIFRPLPLDEFGAQLPYALKIPANAPLLEMDANGKVQPMAARGVDFINTWTGSLHTTDPVFLPFQAPQISASSPETSQDAMLASVVPKANSAMCPVASSSRARPARGSRCPVMAKKKQGVNGEPPLSSAQTIANNTMTTTPFNPTWQDDVYPLFSKPYWVSDPAGTGAVWQSEMCSFSPPKPQELNLDLWDRASVARNVITVYQHLRSKSMPITSDPTEYWPDQALETLRLWANQGFRNVKNDPIANKEIIQTPNDKPMVMRIRKDILSLTSQELQAYRAKLDDVLKVGELNSKWQELGFLHAEWCLHYQEGFALWHRAYLRYVEELIDMPIPYWNCYAGVTSDPSSPYAGIPQIFLDETYVHPNGQTRKNPLKYALALNGKNKNGTGPYPERFKSLVVGRSDPAWAGKVKLFDLYHQQIAGALAKPAYSYPESDTGYPWANLPAFSDNQPTSLYPDFARQYFDGSLEQPHDNYHGWVGPDMADNSFTAFDPLFHSYHANIDRIVEMYIRAGVRQFTSNFPLHPFADNGTALAYSDPRQYVYTTIGDMAKPSQALQYLYAPPVLADYKDMFAPITKHKARGGAALQVKSEHEIKAMTADRSGYTSSSAAKLSSEQPYSSNGTTNGATRTTSSNSSSTPYILFPNITCLDQSVQIDVFVKDAPNLDPDPIDNPDFVGRMTRLGMGPGRGGTEGVKNRTRCIKNPVARILDASRSRDRLQAKQRIQLVVTDLGSGKEMKEEEWEKLSGIKGFLVWA